MSELEIIKKRIESKKERISLKEKKRQIPPRIEVVNFSSQDAIFSL